MKGIIVRKKKQFKYIIMWLIIGILAAVVGHFLLELLHHNYNFENATNFLFQNHTELFFLGTGILFILYTLFSSLFGSSIIGSILLLLISVGFGLTTQYKHLFRAEPFYPNEFYMIRELPFLFEMVGTKRMILIIALIIMAVALMVILYKYVIYPRKKGKKRKTEYILRAIGVILSVGTLFYIGRFNYPGNEVKAVYNDYASWVEYDQTKNYYRNGFIAGFLSNLKAPPMEQPEDYSRKRMETLYEKYENESKEVNESRETGSLDSNILFVMNESFSDPFDLEGITSNEDPLPHYRDIIEESISGKAKASSIGGGTATSEFQALTGFSMEPFSAQITSPYTQLVSHIETFPTVVEKSTRNGHKATAIHPYTPAFYRRNDVYENMNFDEFRHQDNMKNRERISEKHRYISDFAAYEEVFDVMSESEELDFIHLVTMQNHMSYASKYENVDYDVEGSGNASEANAYFEDLENSDISLRLLINKIDNHPEPILLVFWGDHLPGFYEGDVLEGNDQLTMLETPFFVYSNEMELDGEVDLISPIYFNNYITEVLEIKINPYEAILKRLEEYLPVIDNGVYCDGHTQNRVSSRDDLSDETLEILNDYSLLMYDITTGNQYAHELGFFEKN